MNINKINPQELKIKRMLSRVQSSVEKSYPNYSIKPQTLACNLYNIGNECTTPEKVSFLNNCLLSFAKKMSNMKQGDFAGIIYSFLIKFNKDNPVILKKLLPNALKVAEMQKDPIHIAARTGELCTIYHEYEIHGANYLSCLNLRKQALKDICSNYEEIGNRFKTISRPISPKDVYIELLIKTKIATANELAITNKVDAKKELMSAYKDLDLFSDEFKSQNEKTYCMLKKYISIESTQYLLCKDTKFDSIEDKFSIVSNKIVEATKEQKPIENSIFNDFYSSMYDDFKNNSQEHIFIKKSLKLIDKLVAEGDTFISNRIYTILLKKNASNIKNIKIIAIHGLNERISHNDDFGVVFFSSIVGNVIKKDSHAISIVSHLVALQSKINALSNIIKNYDNIPQKYKDRSSKNDYIKSLIYAKINIAKFQKNTNPENAKEAMEFALDCIKKLPEDYVKEHPEIVKTKSYLINLMSRNNIN